LDVITEASKLKGWQFNITYDPTILRGINVIEGNFLKDFGLTFAVGMWSYNDTYLGIENNMGIHNEAGYVKLACTILGSGIYADGQGVLATITFEVVGQGNCELRFDPTQTRLLKSELINGEVIVTDLPFTIHNPVHFSSALFGDLNGDSIVDIFDIVLVCKNFGKTEPREYDFNKDGVIDIIDVMRVAQSMTW
jgi:hypothetical protein